MQKAFIEELGAAIGVPNLALDANASCTIQAEEKLLTLQYQAQDQSFLLYGIVCTAEEFPLAVFKRVASANIFGSETSMMHLAYYEPLQAIVLSAVRSEKDNDMKGMVGWLSFFAEKMEYWQAEIGACLEDVAAQEAEADNETALERTLQDAFGTTFSFASSIDIHFSHHALRI